MKAEVVTDIYIYKAASMPTLERHAENPHSHEIHVHQQETRGEGYTMSS
jgi:hypothetical protein